MNNCVKPLKKKPGSAVQKTVKGRNNQWTICALNNALCLIGQLSTIHTLLFHIVLRNEGSATQGLQQRVKVPADIGVGRAQLCNFSAGVKYSRVVPPAKGIADIGQAVRGQLLCQRHGYLPWAGNGT